jgi:hypothetical protein
MWLLRLEWEFVSRCRCIYGARRVAGFGNKRKSQRNRWMIDPDFF